MYNYKTRILALTGPFLYLFFSFLELILVWIRACVTFRIGLSISFISAIKNFVFFMKTTIESCSKWHQSLQMASTGFEKENCRAATTVVIGVSQGARKDGRGKELVRFCAMCDARSTGPRELLGRNRWKMAGQNKIL